jgi:hypothetical protein
MARPVPSSVMMLIENTETSVNPVSIRITASAPTTATPPTTAGMAAATRLPKISRDSSTTIGSENDSARARSADTIVLTSP